MPALKSRWPLMATTLAALCLSMSAHASALVFQANLLGSNEAPPNSSTGVGTATLTIDLAASTMRVQSSFSGLVGNTTATHIHCCTATAGAGTSGVATMVPTFVGFPSGVKSGSYDNTFDLSLASTFNPSFVTANGGTAASVTALINGLNSGKAYFNIHTTFAGGGEIRGFFAPVVATTSVPEPASVALALGGLAVVGLIGKRRRQLA